MKQGLLFLLLSFSLVACGSAPPAPTPSASIEPTRAPNGALESPTAAPAPVVPTTAPTVTANTAPPSPTASPMPALATLTQLTRDGCCVQPFWSADSKEVLFLDKPNSQAPTGIYGVSLQAPGESKLWSPFIGSYSSDSRFVITFEGSTTVIVRLAPISRWLLDNGRRGVSLSPDRTRVVWNVTPETYPFENRVTTVMIADLIEPKGNEDLRLNGRRLTTVTRGGASGWLDADHLLLTGRLAPTSEVVTLQVYSLADGSTRPLASSERLRSVSPSPDGKWVVYSIAFDKQPESNGIWSVKADGSGTTKLPFFGAWQWRAGSRVVYIPLTLEATSHALFEYDLATGTTHALTDPARLSFKVSNGDWALSPDGNKVVFVNAADKNLWVLTLPPEG